MNISDQNKAFQGFEIQDYIRILFRGRWIIAFSFLTVLGVTLLLNKRAIPVYQSSITLLSEEFRRESMMALGGGATWGYFVGDKPINNKQIMLQSTQMALEVARHIKRSPNCKYVKFFYWPDGRFINEKSMAGILKSRIAVSFKKDSDIIVFTAYGYGKGGNMEAAVIANAYGDVFYEKSFRDLKGEIYEVKKFLTDQIDRYQLDLEKAEEDLRRFKEKENMVELNTETNQLINQVSKIEITLDNVNTTLQTNRMRLQYIRQKLEEKKESMPDEIIHVAAPLMGNLRKELAEQEASYTRFLAQGIPESHQQMIEIRNKISDIKDKLRDQAQGIIDNELIDPLETSRGLINNILDLNIEIASDEVRVEVLSRMKQKYDQELSKLPSKSLTLTRLARKEKLYSDLFLMLTKKYEEMRITEAGKLNSVSIIDRARPSNRPIRPNKRKNVLVGILVGLGLGIGITLLIEFLDASMHSPEEVEKITGLSVLGAIPRIRTEDEKKLQKRRETSADQNVKLIESRLITHFAPKSPIAEAYRTLRTNIQFIRPDNPIRTMMVTSSNPREGKSTSIANLAIALAQMDQRVVLLDTDFRRPIVHSLFGLEREPGLTSVLLGQHTLEEVVRKTEINNLFVVPCGIIPPNPSELLGSKKMEETIERLKEMFDFVMFDSPPIIAVTDAAILASKLDGVVLVLQEGKTRRQDILRSKELLDNVNANIFGIVLNIIDIQKKYGYYYYYYYYYYHNYYTYGEDDAGQKKWWQRKKA